ncbi:minor tail protein [Mycobacterium phage DarthPhader]|uniref:Minor tail protein n=1 Tax=Mycobacterium phage DarthPhader TaxID=1912975 RepID=A0A1I9S3X8_9CAUD|nr:minor tail protein [Mycobacterium phage DarthPhader]AOZ61272.1 minor tail protein [Mycobacterium phage DarthPhader]
MTTYPTTPQGALDAGGAFVIGGGDFKFGQDYNETVIKNMFSVPLPTSGSAVAILQQQLSRLPLESLQYFKNLIPGTIDDDFIDIATAVGTILANLANLPRALLTGDFDHWVSQTFNIVSKELTQIMEILGGIFVTPINQAVQQVKDWWVEVQQQASHVAQTIGDVLGGIWGGLTGRPPTGPKSIADVSNAASNTSQQADTGVQIGEWNNAVLGIRNNKAFDSGMDPTGVSMFAVPASSTPGGEPPYVTATAAAVPIMFWIAPDDAKRGSVTWFGKGNANVTGFYIDVYRMNRATSTMELLHTSPDLLPMLSTGWKALRYNMQAVNRVETAHGDVLAIAFRPTGSGSHQIVGRYSGWLPADPTQVPQRPSAVRTGVGNLAFSSINYQGDIPVAALGIVEGDVPPPYFAPRTTSIDAAGAFSYDIPTWAKYIECVYCSGGGSGRGGNGLTTIGGEGGDAGQWLTETLVRGIDFPENATTITGFVGDGGPLAQAYAAGSPGQATYRAAIPGGKAGVSVDGGAGGNSENNETTGKSPGTITYGDPPQPYVGGNGGAGGRNGSPGAAPGGGGGGGYGGIYGIGFASGAGARGGAWFRARQS